MLQFLATGFKDRFKGVGLVKKFTCQSLTNHWQTVSAVLLTVTKINLLILSANCVEVDLLIRYQLISIYKEGFSIDCQK